eukprot:5002314-Ditylum_brightwellii.AAC.1
MLGPGSTINSIEVADHPTMTRYSEDDDNDEYSLLGPSQIQSPTPHMDRAITEILEFNLLLMRTPQQSNIAKSKQEQEEEPTPNSLPGTEEENTEEQANPPMEQTQANTNNTSQSKNQNSIENQLLLLHTKLSEMENKTKQDLYKMIQKLCQELSETKQAMEQTIAEHVDKIKERVDELVAQKLNATAPP